jgi:hypothetical protein
MKNTEQPSSKIIAAISLPLLVLLQSLLLAPYVDVLAADREVITDDGREVLIKDDGTWMFRSTDRFANTADGQRVRLREDGSWQYVGNAPMVSTDQVKTTELGITLDKTVIERHEIKVQKNKRVKTQTVFYLYMELSPLAGSAIAFNDNDASSIEVADNKGEIYPVLKTQADVKLLTPGARTRLMVRVDGSPSWLDNAKSMEIAFRPGIFGIQTPIKLSQKIDDFEEVYVDGFETNASD